MTKLKEFKITPEEYISITDFNRIQYPDVSMEIGEHVLLVCENHNPLTMVRVINYNTKTHKDHAKLIKLDKIICPSCGSTNVRAEAWINPNDFEFERYSDESFEWGQCHNCGKYVDLIEVTHTIESIDRTYQYYLEKHKKEPLYAKCRIIYPEDMQYDDVLIKLSDCHNVTKKDNKVLEFCSGISDLRSMCDKGTLDFIVTSLYSFE